MSKHTPGPWHWEDINPRGWLVGPNLTVLHFDADEAHEPTVADRHLIAAAPDLLAALEIFANLGDSSIRSDVMTALRPHERESFGDAIARARAAIAKARNESSAATR